MRDLLLYHDFAQIELSLEKSEEEKRWNLFKLCQPGTAVPRTTLHANYAIDAMHRLEIDIA